MLPYSQTRALPYFASKRLSQLTKHMPSPIFHICTFVQRYPDVMMECLVRPLLRKVQSEVPEPEVLATGKDNGGRYGSSACSS